ncbi:MAG: hypothetical protein AAF664_19735 [Planctomycetota bacterium]
MIDKRIWSSPLLIASLVLPVLVYATFGAILVWDSPYHVPFLIAWSLVVCGLALVHAIHHRVNRVVQVAPADAPNYFDDSDRQAMSHVRDFQIEAALELKKQGWKLEALQPSCFNLMRRLADQNHERQSNDFAGCLTLSEIATFVRVIGEDAEVFLAEHLPMHESWTLDRIWTGYRWSNQLGKANQLAWLVSTLARPSNAIRWLVSKSTSDPMAQSMKDEIANKVFMQLCGHLGVVAIDLYRGRMKGGYEAYRTHFAAVHAKSSTHEGENTNEDSLEHTIRVAMIGGPSSGKTSIVAALTGEGEFDIDVIPSEGQGTRHRCQLESTVIEFWDLPSLSIDANNEARLAGQSPGRSFKKDLAAVDALIVVARSNMPAHAPNVRIWNWLDGLFDGHEDPPRRLVAATHIDQLPPASVWEPPVDLDSDDAKSITIRDARTYIANLLAIPTELVIPVCTLPQAPKRDGLDERFLPALLDLLSQRKPQVAMRALEKQIQSRRRKQVIASMGNLASKAIEIAISKSADRSSSPQRRVSE